MRLFFRNIALATLMALGATQAIQAEHVTIIAVNDTHSQIEPASDGQGGVLRRRAIYDQVRSEYFGLLEALGSGEKKA